MKIPHWSKEFKESLSLRLARGHDPEELKKSFGSLVDDLATAHLDPKELYRENRRLNEQLMKLLKEQA